jgi:hypothetical protein
VETKQSEAEVKKNEETYSIEGIWVSKEESPQVFEIRLENNLLKIRLLLKPQLNVWHLYNQDVFKKNLFRSYYVDSDGNHTYCAYSFSSSSTGMFIQKRVIPNGSPPYDIHKIYPVEE